jgi:hypothetical protein
MDCHNLHSVSADEYGIRVGVLVHGCLQAAGEILLEGGVLDDGDLQGIKESEHTLALTTRNTLDLLNVVDLKASIGALLPLHQQGDENSPLRVGMDAAASTLLKCSQEQRGTGRGVELEGLADIVARLGRVLGGGPLNDEDVV